jgi:hypothetical protein
MDTTNERLITIIDNLIKVLQEMVGKSEVTEAVGKPIGFEKFEA